MLQSPTFSGWILVFPAGIYGFWWILLDSSQLVTFSYVFNSGTVYVMSHIRLGILLQQFSHTFQWCDSYPSHLISNTIMWALLWNVFDHISEIAPCLDPDPIKQPNVESPLKYLLLSVAIVLWGWSMRRSLSQPRCWHFCNRILRDRQLLSCNLPSTNKHALCIMFLLRHAGILGTHPVPPPHLKQVPLTWEKVCLVTQECQQQDHEKEMWVTSTLVRSSTAHRSGKVHHSWSQTMTQFWKLA